MPDSQVKNAGSQGIPVLSYFCFPLLSVPAELITTPVEIVGLVHIGVGCVGTLITVLRDEIENYCSLKPLLEKALKTKISIETSVSILSEFVDLPRLKSKFFRRVLADVEEVQVDLKAIQQELLTRSTTPTVFNLSTTVERLEQVNEKLACFDRSLSLVGKIGELVVRNERKIGNDALGTPPH